MDQADDVAYSCFDIVDGVKARFLTADKIEAWRDEASPSSTAREGRLLDELLAMMAKSKLAAENERHHRRADPGRLAGAGEEFHDARRPGAMPTPCAVSRRPQVRIRLHKDLCAGPGLRLQRAAADRVQGRADPAEAWPKRFSTIISGRESRTRCSCRPRCTAPCVAAEDKPAARAAAVRSSLRHDRRLRAAQLQAPLRSRLRLDLGVDLTHGLPLHRRTDLP